MKSLQMTAVLLAAAIAGTSVPAWAAGGGGGGGGQSAGTTTQTREKKQDRAHKRDRKRIHADSAASGAGPAASGMGAQDAPVRGRQQERNTVRNQGDSTQVQTQDRNRTATQERAAQPAASPAASGAASR